MIATVTYPYRDRETYEIHRTGFAELSAAGYVDAAEQAAEPEPEEPEKAEADEADEDAAKEAKDVHEMTAAEMRAEIEAMGGFAPKKATKAQLAELLEQL